MNLAELLSSTDIQAIGWALVHFVWQGTLVAAVLAALDAVLRLRQANARYLAATAALAVMAVLPVVTFLGVREGLARTDANMARSTYVEPGVSTPAARAAAGEPLAAAVVGLSLRQRLDAALPALVAAWCIGVALLSSRSLGGWVVARRLTRAGRTKVPAVLEQTVERLRHLMGIERAVELWESALVEVPTVVGSLRPIVLLPASTLIGLSPVQLELILAHELAHVRRHDYLLNLAQTVVETLLFYHPAVWWVSRRMRVERENCCDDLAVAAGGDAVSYARALAHLEGLRAAVPAAAMAATGGSLLERVSRLVSPAPAHVPRSSRWLAGIAVLGMFGGTLLVVPALKGDAGGRAGEDAPPQANAQPDAERAADGAAADEQQTVRPRLPADPRPSAAARSHDKVPAERVRPSVAKILELLDAGVNPEFADAMAEAGYDALSWDELVQLRNHGVDAPFVKALATLGYTQLSADRLVAVRSQGVTPDFIQGLKEQGLSGLALEDLVFLRSQGVSPEYVGAMKRAGYSDVSVTSLVGLRSQGVTPEYAAELVALGYRGLSTARLVALRSQGISTDYIRELKELGYTDLSIPVLIGLRSQGVGPDFVRGLKAQGYAGLSTGALIELRSQGVTPDFAGGMKAQGFTDVSPEQLIALRSQGVTPDFVRELKEAGLTHLSVAEAIELRSRGVRPDLLKRLRKPDGGAR